MMTGMEPRDYPGIEAKYLQSLKANIQVNKKIKQLNTKVNIKSKTDNGSK